MKITRQEDLSAAQKLRIMNLWNKEYPANLAYADISGFEEFLNSVSHKRHFLLLDESNEILGWAMIFQRDNADWFSIIIDGSLKGQGYGTKLVNELKRHVETLYGWAVDRDDEKKLDGEFYRSPLEFYKKIGFRINENEKMNSEKISCVKIEWIR